jgi:hypothetical protein
MRKLFIIAAMLCGIVLVPAPALALPAAPAQAGPFTVANALLDSVVKNGNTQTQNSQQQLLGYTMSYHDSNYQYTLPICYGVVMIDGSGSRIQDATTFNTGDNLVVTAGPNPQTGKGTCITYIVRQVQTPAANGSNCLQNLEVTHTIAPADATLVPQKSYTFNMQAFVRPTKDCDASIYGTTPIAVQPAANTLFDITVMNGSDQLLQSSLATDSKGNASFVYTFPSTGQYTVRVTSDGDQTPGDFLAWPENVQNSSPSTAVARSTTAPHRSAPIWPIFAFAGVILIPLAIGGLEFWLMLKKRRAHELPIDEYMRAPRL